MLTDALLTTALRLDNGGDYRDVLSFLHIDPQAAEVAHQVHLQLLNSQFLTAYLTACLFCGSQPGNAVLWFARGVGAFLFGDLGDETRPAAVLGEVVDRLTADQQRMLLYGVVQPVIERIVMQDASLVHDRRKALRLLEIVRAASPELRAMFEWTEKAPEFDLATLRSREGHTKLIMFPSVPERSARKPLRAAVAMRELVFPGHVGSRKYDMGWRLCAAMSHYGWHTTLFPMSMTDYEADAAGIFALCERSRADLLFLDDYCVLTPATHGLRAALVSRLRETLPDLKLVVIHLDPWIIPSDVLLSTVSMVDAVWAPFPSMPIWRDSSVAHKLVYVPLPHAGLYGLPNAPLLPRLTFTGGVFGYNWHRVFWLAAAQQSIPFEFHQSTHISDGMSVLDSYAAYFRQLAASGASVNFSMRPNLSRILTGRFFETVLSGALLVQEETPDMAYYLTPGEHFLSFRSISELRAIVRFIDEAPEQAEMIRRCGNDFARTHYNDESLIGYLDAMLSSSQQTAGSADLSAGQSPHPA